MARAGEATEAMVERELNRTAAFRTQLRRFLRTTASVTARFGLTPERYDLLLMIRTSGRHVDGVPLTELCERLQLRQTAVTELVKRAVDAGLVERRKSADDGRVRLLRLTPEGDQRLQGALVALREDRLALAEAFLDLDERFRDAHR
jgi:DNA-binding MarR family transcriptional regulator